MKRYGLKIGDIGVEFPSREEREKALMLFTKGVDVKISTSGIRYQDGTGSFSVYERLSEETLVTCYKCGAIFGIDVCPEREYPNKNSWDKEFTVNTAHICDACFASAIKSKEIFEAKKLINHEE